jgi:hypothetical protein
MKEVKGTERDRMFVLFVSKDDDLSWAESARKAMVVLPPHEGQKHQKWSKATQILMSSVVHSVPPRACF